MNLENINDHLEAYKNHDQIIDAAEFIISTFGLEHENFAGFGFRPELEPDRMLLTAEGEVGGRQMVMIPKNLFDFDINLVVNMLAHEMLHVRQKAPENLIAKFSACSAGRVAKKKRRKAEIIFADFLIVSSKFMICDFFLL